VTAGGDLASLSGTVPFVLSVAGGVEQWGAVTVTCSWPTRECAQAFVVDVDFTVVATTALALLATPDPAAASTFTNATLLNLLPCDDA